MTDPLAYLTAALDAAQRDAEAATPGPWYATPREHDEDFEASIGSYPEGANVAGHGYEGGGVDTLATAAHIVRQDPASTLRLVAKHREVLAEHSLATEVHDRRKEVRAGGSCYCHGTPMVAETVEVAWCMTCHDEDHAAFEAFWHGFQGGPCTTVRLLAEGYGWTETEQR